MDDSLSELSRITLLKGEFLELKDRCYELSDDLKVSDELLEFADEEIGKLEVTAQTAKEDRDWMFWVGIATLSAVLFAPDVADLIRFLITTNN